MQRNFLHVSIKVWQHHSQNSQASWQNSVTQNKTRKAQAWNRVNKKVQWVTLRGSTEKWNQTCTFHVYFYIQVVNKVEKSQTTVFCSQIIKICIHWKTESTRKDAVKLWHSVPTVTHQQVHLLGIQWFYTHITADSKKKKKSARSRGAWENRRLTLFATRFFTIRC